MAVVAKWLTHRIVAPTLGGSIPLSRPILINNCRLDSLEALGVQGFLFF